MKNKIYTFVMVNKKLKLAAAFAAFLSGCSAHLSDNPVFDTLNGMPPVTGVETEKTLKLRAKLELTTGFLFCAQRTLRTEFQVPAQFSVRTEEYPAVFQIGAQNPQGNLAASIGSAVALGEQEHPSTTVIAIAKDQDLMAIAAGLTLEEEMEGMRGLGYSDDAQALTLLRKARAMRDRVIDQLSVDCPQYTVLTHQLK